MVVSLVNRVAKCLLSAGAAVALLSCGSRSALEPYGNGGPPGDAEDRCFSAVVGPKPMIGNCSTRDGRSRVPAPKDPHVIWAKKLAFGPETKGFSVFTDDTNHLYVISNGGPASPSSIRRLRATDGAIEWTLSVAPKVFLGSPTILSNGVIEVRASDIPVGATTLLEIDAVSGTKTDTTIGLNLKPGPELAVGSDGSRFVVHPGNDSGTSPPLHLSRARPDGSIAWTSIDLATLVGAPKATDVYTPQVAVGADDTAIIIVDGITSAGFVAVAAALDPENGALLWQTPLPVQPLGGPAILPDGTVAVLGGSVAAVNLVFLDPDSGKPTTYDLGFGAFGIHAITRTGVVIAGTYNGDGGDGLIALSRTGKTLWTRSMPITTSPTLAADGTLIGCGKESKIFALNSKTGATKWELAAANPGSMVSDVALTSAGMLVAVQSDGTVFAAAD